MWLRSQKGWKQEKKEKRKSLLFSAFFQLLSVLLTAQVTVYHSTSQSEPESFTVGCVVWKCVRKACLHCGGFCKCSLLTDVIFILRFSCTYFNPTKAASLHIVSLLFLGTHRNICSYVRVVLVPPWSWDSGLNKSFLVLSHFTFP